MRKTLARLLVALSAPAAPEQRAPWIPAAREQTRLRAIATTVLELAGLALIVAGIALLSLSAALIVAGGALLLVSWRATR